MTRLPAVSPGVDRMRPIVANVLLSAAAVLFTLGVLEAGVRLFVDFDELKPRAIRFVDPDKPIAFQPHKTWTYVTDEFEYTVQFNRFGRRDVEWSDSVIADPGNILFIGDSFVIGNGVEDQHTVPTLLERALAGRGHDIEVFNFGMPDGRPETYSELLDDALASGFAAHTIIVGTFIGNDFYDRQPRKQRPEAHASNPPVALGGWPPRSELFRFIKLRVSQSPLFVGWAFAVGKAFGISVYETSGSYVFLREPTQEQARVFSDIVDSFGGMKRRCDAAGREFRLVVFPNKIQVENGDDLTSATFDSTRPNRLIMQYCAKEGFRCLDLLPTLVAALEGGDGPFFYPIDRHMNPHGNGIAAGAIAHFLLDATKPPGSQPSQ